MLEDDPESVDEHDAGELARLRRFVTRPGPSFGLALATFASVSQADDQRSSLVEELAAADRSVAELELRFEDGDGDLVHRIGACAASADAVFVSGLDYLVRDSAGQRRATRAIAELNFRRDELPGLVDARVVFWISNEGYLHLAKLAWDLLQVMLTRFELRGRADPSRARGVIALGLERPREPTLARPSASPSPRPSSSGPPSSPSPPSGPPSPPSPPSARPSRAPAAARPRLPARRPPAAARPPSPRKKMAKGAAPPLSKPTPQRVIERQATTLVALADEAEQAQTRGDASASAAALYDQVNRPKDAARLRRQAADAYATTDTRRAAEQHRQLALLALRQGDGEAALREASLAIELARDAGDIFVHAMCWDALADVLFVRGEFDEVLRIRRDQQLPLYEQLDSDHGRASTWGQIADLLFVRGELDEALRIRQTEELPRFEASDDRLQQAMSWGKIADILFARGQLDEALRMRQQQELPLYGELFAPFHRAIALGKIADILEARGELDEALRIRETEELPVFEERGDLGAQALTRGKIADNYAARGQLDRAIEIRRQEQLPIYLRLGFARGLAFTRLKLAQELAQRGDPGDQAEIEALAREALAGARKLGLGELPEIERAVHELGLES